MPLPFGRSLFAQKPSILAKLSSLVNLARGLLCAYARLLARLASPLVLIFEATRLMAFRRSYEITLSRVY
jgi:hypothetical protein